MGMLGSLIDVSTISLAGRSMACAAISLPSAADYVSWIGLLTQAGTVSVMSRPANVIWLWNEGGSAVGGSVVSYVFHSIIR